MKTTASIVAMLLCFISTFAASITHTATILPSFTDWSVTNSIPQFDPSRGTLTNVVISIDANVASTIKLENGSSLARTLTGGSTATVSATLAGYGASASVTNTHTQAFPRFDGVRDYAGSGSVTSTSQSDGEDVIVITPAPFIGVGNTPLVVTAVARGFYRGPADYEFEVATTASALVTVTYEFSPPTCPPVPTCDPKSSPKDCDDRRKPRNRRR